MSLLEFFASQRSRPSYHYAIVVLQAVLEVFQGVT